MYIKLTGILLSFLFLFSCAGIKNALKKDAPEIEEVVENIEEKAVDSLQEQESIVQDQEEIT